MKPTLIRFIVRGGGRSLTLAAGLLLTFAACTDDAEPAVVDSVWLNIADAPTHTVECAYPKQVLRLQGKGFSRLTALYVNDTPVSTDGSYIYATDAAYTFTVPADVHISEDYDAFTIRVVTDGGETLYTPFLIKPSSEKPAVTRTSSTMLVAGTSLTLTGRHLEGATEVWLPTAFDGRVQCELDPATPPTATTVTVLVPSGQTFVSGQAEIVMEKTEYVTTRKGRTYRESVYSSTIDFQ
jgi:hypothetical protein